MENKKKLKYFIGDNNFSVQNIITPCIKTKTIFILYTNSKHVLRQLFQTRYKST